MTTLDLARTYVALYGNRLADTARYRTLLDFRGVDVAALERIARNYHAAYKLMSNTSPASGLYTRLAGIRRRLSDEADELVTGRKQLSLFAEAA